MEKLIAIKKDGMIYTLKAQNGTNIKLALEFLCEHKFEENDAIYLHQSIILQNKINLFQIYTFSNIDSKFGKELLSQDDEDFAKIEKQNGATVLLKRVYG